MKKRDAVSVYSKDIILLFYYSHLTPLYYIADIDLFVHGAIIQKPTSVSSDIDYDSGSCGTSL